MNGEPQFIHLHVHSEYSMQDGCISIKKIIERAKQWGQSHVALTDHGNMHGAVEFYSEAKKAGIVPIIGCEIYLEPNPLCKELVKAKDIGSLEHEFHLVLLAKDTQGYKSLMQVVSSGFAALNLKEVPVVSLSALASAKSIVALTSCLKGEFAYYVELLRQFNPRGELSFSLKENDERSQNIIKALTSFVDSMHSVFGANNFYVELIDNNLTKQKAILPDLVAAARHYNLPIVATQDVHYLDDSFSKTHALAIAIKNNLTMSDIGKRLLTAKFHYANDKEIREKFAQWPDAIDNTFKIAKECSFVEISMGKYFLPKIETPEKTSSQLLREQADEGLKERLVALSSLYKEKLDEERKLQYWQRLEYELKVIIDMGFADYFLIVSDFINWAKKQKIPVGPGRGSGAGSLVAYSLRITDLDPLAYTLLFERFLNPERISMPDFDVDFCQWRREEVINYCIQKYGIKNVAQITTFGRMQAKAAVKSVGRAMNINYTTMDQFTKLFPNDLGITIKAALAAEPRLNEALEQDENLKSCIEFALKLEGMISHTSVHAAGLVISDGDMTNYVPVYSIDGKNLITQYEMKPTEKVGLVKFDFLGLKTLTVIDKAVSLVQQRLVSDFDISKIPLDDKSVYDMISQGHTIGIFQCESAGITQLIKKLKPSQFEDIIALVALFRPGPLGSGMVDDFVLRKHGKQEISYPHPDLEPILRDTYGMILYQEQVQSIAAILANYSLGEADLLRRAMGKKIPEEMAQQKDRFLSGAKERKIDERLAEDIFDLMAEFAKYGFNKSHSAAYGLVSYQTGYLKTKYPEEFLAASMTCDMDNTDKIIRYAEDCWRLGFKVLPPDINRSELFFDVPGAKMVGFALAGIKGVGHGAVTRIIEERKKNGPYKSVMDLVKRIDLGKVGKKVLQLLIEAGALDCFARNRRILIQFIPDLVNFSSKHHEALQTGQRSLFSFSMHMEEIQVGLEPWEDDNSYLGKQIWDIADLYAEKKLLGIFLSGHPLDSYRQDLIFGVHDFSKLSSLLKGCEKDRFGKISKRVDLIGLFAGVSYRRSKKGSLMAYLKLEQKGSSLEGLMFEKNLKTYPLPKADTCVLAHGILEKQDDEGTVRFTIERIIDIAEVRQQRVKSILLRFSAESCENTETAKYMVEKLSTLLKKNSGPTPLNLEVDHPKAVLSFDIGRQEVELSDDFVLQIKALGQEVEVHYAL